MRTQTQYIDKLNKRAILKHLIVRFAKDYQMDILTFVVAAEFAYILIK